MSSDFTIKGSRELLLVAERIALDKEIPFDSVLIAMQDGIKLATKKKYGTNLDIDCIIDKKSGDICIYNKLEVVDDEEEKNPDFDYRTQIGISNAVDKLSSGKALYQEELEIGESIKVPLPPIDLDRIIAQIAKNEILKKIKEAEKEKEYNEFKNKVSSIVVGVVKKKGLKNLVVEVDGHETLLKNEYLIPGEQFRIGDRIKAYVLDVSKDKADCLILLSRTHNQFLVELMRQSITEIYDGFIEIKGIVRDPGSKAKVLVYSKDNFADVIGVCVGPRGSKIQGICDELKGEKIDVIKWSDKLPDLIANVLTPAKVSKVIIHEDTGKIEVIVPQNQLSLAIGRSGQNIKLSAKLLGRKLDIMTDEEEQTKRVADFKSASELFIKELDVDEVIGQLLASYGYNSIEDLAGADLEDLEKIEGFDKDVAIELHNRAEETLNYSSKKYSDKDKEEKDDLQEIFKEE